MYTIGGGILENDEFISKLSIIVNSFPKVKNNKKVEYYNIPAGFDIETSSFYQDGEKRSCMYLWQLGIYNIVTIGRTYESFLEILGKITEILKNSYIPENFVFQPMKNVRKVREFLLENCAEIILDEPFESFGKFYFVIKGKKNGKKIFYSEAQLEYGLNSASADSRKYLLSELNKKLLYLERPLNEQTRTKIEKEVGILKEVLDYES